MRDCGIYEADECTPGDRYNFSNENHNNHNSPNQICTAHCFYAMANTMSTKSKNADSSDSYRISYSNIDVELASEQTIR